MALPANIYAALGGASAAIIGGWISLTNMIIAKDQKVSEFRQRWTEDLRNCVSQFCSDYLMLSSSIHYHQVLQAGKSPEDMEQLVAEAVSRYAPTIRLQITKIRLLLNPSEDVAAFRLLASLEARLADVSLHFQALHEIEPAMAEFEGEIKQILKREWECVKQGEGNYRRYKSFSGFMPMGLFAIAIAALLISHFTKS